jgi:DNA replication protein DnaC
MSTKPMHAGPNGVGKSTLALNLAYQALVHGHTALFTTAGQMLGELAALDSDSALRRRLHHYASPDVLVIDGVGHFPLREAPEQVAQAAIEHLRADGSS